jgi:protein kinase-like protein
MALMKGARLGPYEIAGPIGSGGMGEVYRARDIRLERTVAIKVLPSHLSSNPDLRARFEREAKAISALQHPNVCVLYDVGRQEGVDFLVMEYLEGETLATRLARKPLTPDEALRIGIEIADALAKAHRSGIVHRASGSSRATQQQRLDFFPVTATIARRQSRWPELSGSSAGHANFDRNSSQLQRTIVKTVRLIGGFLF